MVDKRHISKGLVRIGFIRPKVDIVILCKPGELKVFADTVEIVHNLKEPTFTHRECSSKERSFYESHDGQCHRSTFHDANCRNGDDVSKLCKTCQPKVTVVKGRLHSIF